MTLTQIKPAGLSKPVDLADNEKIRLGTGNDLELYHSGTQSYVTDQGTGNLNLQGTSKVVIGNAAHNENMAQFFADGAVELYYDNVKKLDTQPTSVRLFDDLVMSANNIQLNDNAQIQIGNAPDMRIYHDGSHSYITNTTGDLTLVDESRIKLRTDQFVLNNHANDESIIYAAADGEVSLYHNGTKRFDTTSTGVNIFGSDTTGSNLNGDLVINNAAGTRYAVFDASHTKLNFSDNAEATFGDSHDLRLYHNGSNSYLKQGATGDLYIDAANGASADIRMRAQAHIYAQVNGNEEAFQAFANGAVELYYDSVKKIETTSDGVKFNGSALFPDNQRIKIGGDASNPDFQIYHDGSNTRLIEGGTGDLYLDTTAFRIRNGAGNENVAAFIENGQCELYYDNTKKLETTANGIKLSNLPDNAFLLLDQNGRQSSFNDYFSTSSTGSKISIDISTGSTDGSKTRSVDFWPNGMSFNGDTAASNRINDYEEGTYSPALGANGNISGGNGLGCTYTTQTGYYVKIGNFVFCNGILVWTAKSGTLNNTTVNLTLSIPFAMGGTGNQGAGQLSYNSAIDFNADCRNVHGVGSNAFIYFERVSTGSGKHTGYVKTQNLDSSGQINFAFSYRML